MAQRENRKSPRKPSVRTGKVVRFGDDSQKKSATEIERERILAERFGGKAIIVRNKGETEGTITTFSSGGGKQVSRARIEQTSLPQRRETTRTQRRASDNVITTLTRTDARGVTIVGRGLVTPQGAFMIRGPQPQAQDRPGTVYRDIDDIGDAEKSFLKGIAEYQSDQRRARIDAWMKESRSQAKEEKIAITLFGKRQVQNRPDAYTSGSTQMAILAGLQSVQIEREQKAVSEARSAFSESQLKVQSAQNVLPKMSQSQQDEFYSDINTKYTQRLERSSPQPLSLRDPYVQGRVVESLESQDPGYKGGSSDFMGGRYEAITGIPRELTRTGVGTVMMLDDPGVRAKGGGGWIGQSASFGIRGERLPQGGQGDFGGGLAFTAKTTPSVFGASALLLATPLVAKGTAPLSRGVTRLAFRPRLTDIKGDITVTYLGTTDKVTRIGRLEGTVQQGLFSKKKTPVSIFVTEVEGESSATGFTRIYRQGSSDLIGGSRYTYVSEGGKTFRVGEVITPGKKGAKVKKFREPSMTSEEEFFKASREPQKYSEVIRETESKKIIKTDVYPQSEEMRVFASGSFVQGRLKPGITGGSVRTRNVKDTIITIEDKNLGTSETRLLRSMSIDTIQARTNLKGAIFKTNTGIGAVGSGRGDIELFGGRLRISRGASFGRKGQASLFGEPQTVVRRVPKAKPSGRVVRRPNSRFYDFDREIGRTRIGSSRAVRARGRGVTSLRALSALKSAQIASSGVMSGSLNYAGQAQTGLSGYSDIQTFKRDVKVSQDLRMDTTSELRTFSDIKTVGIGTSGGDIAPSNPPPDIPPTVLFPPFIGGFGGGSQRSRSRSRKVRGVSRYQPSIAGISLGIRSVNLRAAKTGIGIRGG